MKLIFIAGATGVGKSEIGVMLAQKINSEIISADSMQIYRHMDIGTGKISPDDMKGIPHHMIDIIEPDEEYSVAQYQNDVLNICKKISNAGKIPIIVGGTGLYINSLIYDMNFNDTTADLILRKRLQELYEIEGREELLNILRELDPKKAEIIDPYNIKRVIRAIEIAKIQGENKEFSKDIKLRENIEFKFFVLTSDRQKLYQRIEKRVDKMRESGLVEEVKQLKEKYNVTYETQSMKGIGYRQILAYLEGKTDIEETFDKIKQESRKYAKRQSTWFKRYKFAQMIYNSQIDQTLKIIFDETTKDEFLQSNIY